MKVTVGLHLHTAYAKGEGFRERDKVISPDMLFPIRYRIYCKDCETPSNPRRHYSSGIELTKPEFERMFHKNIKGHLRGINDRLNSEKEKIELFIEDHFLSQGLPFTFDRFERTFFNKENVITQKKSLKLRDLFEKKIANFKPDQVSSKTNYECALNSFESFQPNVKITDIDPDWLEKYAKSMKDDQCSEATIGIYLRSLRAVYNYIMAKNLVPKSLISADTYPFGKYKYVIEKGDTRDCALEQSEVQQIIDFKDDDTNKRRSRHFFLFSFFANGMNMADIAHLKIGNIDLIKDCIIYQRVKTKSRTKKAQQVKVEIGPFLKRLIQKRLKSLPKASSEDYLFPILSPGLSHKEVKDKIQQYSKNINLWLGRICEDLEWEKQITMTWARHSFGTISINSGANPVLVSKGMGHTDLKTTYDNYVSYSPKEMKEQANNLDKMFAN